MSAFGEMTEEEIAKKEEERFKRTMNKSKPFSTPKAPAKIPAWKQAELDKQKKEEEKRQKEAEEKAAKMAKMLEEAKREQEEDNKQREMELRAWGGSKNTTDKDEDPSLGINENSFLYELTERDRLQQEQFQRERERILREKELEQQEMVNRAQERREKEKEESEKDEKRRKEEEERRVKEKIEEARREREEENRQRQEELKKWGAKGGSSYLLELTNRDMEQEERFQKEREEALKEIASPGRQLQQEDKRKKEEEDRIMREKLDEARKERDRENQERHSQLKKWGSKSGASHLFELTEVDRKQEENFIHEREEALKGHDTMEEHIQETKPQSKSQTDLKKEAEKEALEKAKEKIGTASRAGAQKEQLQNRLTGIKSWRNRKHSESDGDEADVSSSGSEEDHSDQENQDEHHEQENNQDSEINQFLERLGLKEHVPLFTQEAIDMDTVKLLSDSDLTELGLPLGHRKKLMKAIHELTA